MRKPGKRGKIDADLDEEVDHYEPSSSDDEFNKEEKNLINNAVGRKQISEVQEIFKIHSSSEDSDEEGGGAGSELDSDEEGGGAGSELDSDIEDIPKDDGLPDPKAWGSDRKHYYDTDYVDKDFLGFDDEEAALQEEKEADSIQKRLLSHLEGADFFDGLFDEVEEKKKEAAKKSELELEPEIEEKVEVDFSNFSREECLEFLNRESPELIPIVNHCKTQIVYLRDKVLPILDMVDAGTIKMCKAVEVLYLANRIILHYSMNVMFYLHLKETGQSTHNHPIIKRLNGFRLLIQELESISAVFNPEIDIILDAKMKGEDLTFLERPIEQEPKTRKEKRKRKQELLEIKNKALKISKTMKKRLLRIEKKDEVILELNKPVIREEKPKKLKIKYDEDDEGEEADEEERVEFMEGEKRGVTFNIMKNKGLTPRRKKENRNPRVKNRNKFKKAVKRRRGQFREPRKELTKYGGEFSGINKHISKSVKLK